MVIYEPFSSIDVRGGFCKPFDRLRLAELGVDFVVAESFWSSSKRGVVRGLHYQRPPYECGKVVTVVSGLVMDVWLNLETGESGFKYLTGEHPMCVYIPKGYAHGFEALTDCVVLYYQDVRYSVEHDAGVHYLSADVPWGDDPVLSERDKGFKCL